MKINSPLSLTLLLALAVPVGALAQTETIPVTLATTTTNATLDTTNAPEPAAPPAPAIPVLQIKADQVAAKVSPMLYGLMTEEINYSYEGGLYGELIRNRSFMANPTNAAFWSVFGNGTISLDTNQPLNAALNVSLKLDARKAAKNSPVGIANDGYWGIPLKPSTAYRMSFFVKGKKFKGPLKVSLYHVYDTNEVTVQVHPPGKNDSAKPQSFEWFPGKVMLPLVSVEIPKIADNWQQYELTLKTPDKMPGWDGPSKNNRLIIETTGRGTVWFQQVSLFPPTYKDRANGNRPDLMQLMADMQPKFLRFPGGNYLEGNYIWTRFNWKNTIGNVAWRPGHENDAWGYWSTDGMGLLEFLNWCEDLNMEPVLAVFAGYALKRDYVQPGPELEPYVQEALDEIEYVIGDTNTPWGAYRAQDGHPAPFPLRYVEIGNEDWFDRSGSYDGRFTQIYDAIKARHPDLQIIATTKTKTREPDVIDEHFYRSQEEMEAHAHDYDQRSRDTKTKVFVGEWATRVGSPTPNMAGALGDAAWMTGMERNSDLVIMSCYAPLFVNVSDLGKGRSMQWKTDLIGYDALNSYGSPAYHAQKMFSTHLGDVVLATGSQGIPTYTWQPPVKRNRDGVEQPRPPAQEVPTLFFNATRDSKNGTIYLKVVNRRDVPQPVAVEISGCSVAADGAALVLKADRPEDTNSIQDPAKIVPVPEPANELGASFTRTFPPYSITVLELKAK